MTFGQWLIILGEILIIIGKRIPAAQAVKIVAEKHGVSEEEIWQRGGFGAQGFDYAGLKYKSTFAVTAATDFSKYDFSTVFNFSVAAVAKTSEISTNGPA